MKNAPHRNRVIAGLRRNWLPFACLSVISLAAISSASAERIQLPTVQPTAQFRNRLLNELFRMPLPARATLRAQLGFPPFALSESKNKRHVKVKMLKPFVLSAAADGDQLYTVQTTRDVPAIAAYLSATTPLPIKIVRTTISTGQQQTIFNSTRTVLFGFVAGSGKLAVSGIRVAANGKRSFVVDTQLLATDGPAGALKRIENQSASLRHTGNLCGSIDLLSSISSEGDFVLTRISGSCAGKALPHASLVNYDQSGNIRTLRARADLGSMFNQPIQLKGQKLFTTDALSNGLQSEDLVTGQITRFWAAQPPTSFDTAADGSVALVDDNGDFGDNNRGLAVTPRPGHTITVKPPPPAPSPGVIAPTTGATGTPTPSLTYPLIAFPQGDADEPVVASADARDTSVKYCGSRLYSIQTVRKHSRFDESFGDPFSTLSLFEAVKLKISVIDPSTKIVKPIITTKRMVVTALGCAGESLQVAQGRTLKQIVVRYGP